MNNKKNKV